MSRKATVRFTAFQEMQKNVEADWSELSSSSQEGQALVRRMLAKAYEERPSAMECTLDAWFGANDEMQVSAGVPDAEAQCRVDRLQRRARLSFYGKVLLNMMASQLSGELLKQEREVFMQIDKDGSGLISAQELLDVFRERGWDLARASGALQYFDIDASGALSFNEWLAATVDLDVEGSTGLTDQVQSLFSQLDRDGNGSIEFTELRERFGDIHPEHENALQDFFTELDSNEDGAISLAEFEQFWQSLA